MDVSIGQARRRKVCYLCGKTGHFAHKCSNQKAQIRAVLCAITGKERQVWADEVKKLNENNIRDKQPIKKAPLKEDFVEA